MRAVFDLTKVILCVLGLTILFFSFQLLTHIPIGFLSPISAGYMTGGIMRVTGRQALASGITLFSLTASPAPIAYFAVGFFDHIAFAAILAFSLVLAMYYSVITGIMMWIGGGGFRQKAATNRQ